MFGTAKLVLHVTVFLGWMVIFGAAVIGFLIYLGGGIANPLQIGLGVALFVMNGLIVVTVGQMGLAQIATAENTRDMLTAIKKMSEFGRTTAGKSSAAQSSPRVDPPISR